MQVTQGNSYGNFAMIILIVNRLMFEIQINHIALNYPDKYNEYEFFSELRNKGFYTWDPDWETHRNQN